MDEVDDIEWRCLEFLWVEAPFAHLIEEVGIAGPILNALEVAVEAGAAVGANLVDVDVVTLA